MKISEVRQKYLDYFKDKEHVELKSASLLPENDSTTLFTGSGMQPMIPYLLGESHPEGDKITDSQKCFRTEDIEEVGDNRHTTFFEMLGNWSLGAYFKKEQMAWIWDLLINKFKIDPNNFYVTVFKGEEKNNLPKDTEAALLWQKLYAQVGMEVKIATEHESRGMQLGEKIFYYDSKENWWSRAGIPDNMPVGEPGGPDSELFYDFDPEGKLKLHENSKYKDQPCHPSCDCGRFLEIGNSVFMTYKKTNQGYEKLEKKNIDFGGGLERITAAINNVADVFELDIFIQAKNKIEEISGKKYKESDKITFAFRVILDHLRASTMLISDGALPSNKEAGYITRRLIRRAVRFARDLGITDNFCPQVAETYISLYQDQYPNVLKNKDKTLKALDDEETKFRKTLEKGLKEFGKMARDKEIDANEAFILFSTYGFPLELTQELAEERGFKIDKKVFLAEFSKHKELSRTASAGKFKGGLADSSIETTKLHTAAHLLLAALREVLGDHVAQKGSNITGERLRFDFSHPEKMTVEQKQQVEIMVNKWIKQDLEVGCEEMTVEQADKKGAQGAFKDRYGEKVKVYTVKGSSASGGSAFSREICGGPHIKRTSELGNFKIIKEESSSAGVRRIKAILE